MTPVEKVARAIAEADMEFFEETPLRFAEMASAAIKAMRRPTPAMYAAAFDALVPSGDARACWEAMIDAALSESTPSPEK